MNSNYKLVIAILLYIILFGGSLYIYQVKLTNPVAHDKGYLLPVKIKNVTTAKEEKQLQNMVRHAADTGEKFSIAGMQHSQGGHTLYPNATMIDMKQYNDILDFDEKNKLITVQAGATWDDIQQYINPYGLAIKVSQSQNIFTVGGSISVNVHGRDIRNDSLIDTVQSFRLLTADGEVIQVSRTENAHLFPYVLGGYGLFGIILDVTLQLTDDELYVHENDQLYFTEYTEYFKRHVLKNDHVKMHLARISVAPHTFLEEMYVTNYTLAPNQENIESYNRLKGEPIVAFPKFFLGLSRYSDWGKNLFWDIQKKYMEKTNQKLETRNNVMRSDSTFMEYDSTSKVELLQEYFIPIDQFAPYINDVRNLLEAEEDFNLLNITIRYVEKNDHAVMSYAKDDMFALVLLINQGQSQQDIEETGRVIRKMIDITLEHGGSFYLPYYPYPTKEQLVAAYPLAEEFFAKKREFDPNERWMNLFYEEYGK